MAKVFPKLLIYFLNYPTHTLFLSQEVENELIFTLWAVVPKIRDVQVSYPNMAILKPAHILENTARRGKISSVSTTSGRKGVYVQLVEPSSVTKFHAQPYFYGQQYDLSRQLLV